MADDISVLKPWTIKKIDACVAEDIVAEAQRTGSTAGALIERMWAAWKANGSPVQMPAPAAPSDIREFFIPKLVMQELR